jgi:hypothetical protein
MRYGGGHGHLPRVAEAGYQRVHDAACGAVPLDQSDLGHIAVGGDAALGHGQFELERACRGLVLDDADDVGGDGIGAYRGGDGKVFCLQIAGHVNGFARVFGPVVVGAVHEAFTTFGYDHATGDNRLDGECFEIRGQDDVGPPARGQGADFTLQPEVGSGIDRCHLQRHQRITAAVDGVANDTVHMAVIDQRGGMASVGAQDHVAAVQPALGYGGDLALDVIPRRAEADHSAHPLTHAGDGVDLMGALMIIGGTTCDIGGKGRPQIGGGIVAADSFAARLRGGNLCQHLGIGIDHAWKVHHFAQADDAFPFHGLRHVSGGDLEACGLHPWSTGCAGGHLGEDVDRLYQRLVMHHAHAFQTEHIGDLMRVGEHRGCAMGNHGAGEFSGGEHAALDMHVAIAQARDHVAVLRLDDLGVWPCAVFRVRADKGDVACALAEAAGGTILQAPKDKPHGLREAYILCENGYAWVPSCAL